jgi:ABC-type Zn uptake system ZnuABC Zn-binding protein ZnuA
MISPLCWSLALIALFLSPAAQTQAASAARPPSRHKIVCTVGMVADIVRNIAGDRADVSNLIGEGVDPHLYKASRNDIAALQAADAVFYSGLMLEGKMGDAFVSLARGGKKVYAVTQLIDEKFLSSSASRPATTTRVWMDVRLGRAASRPPPRRSASSIPPALRSTEPTANATGANSTSCTNTSRNRSPPSRRNSGS